MAQPVFKNSPGGRRQRNDYRWHAFSPHVLAVRGVLLVDDIIHNRVQNAADWTIVKTEKATKGKVQLTKRKLIIPALALGTVASTAAVGLFEGQGVVGALKWLAIFGVTKLTGISFSLTSLHDTINKDYGDVKTFMQRDAEFTLRVLRLSMLTLVGTIAATADYSKLYDVYISGVASAEFSPCPLPPILLPRATACSAGLKIG